MATTAFDAALAFIWRPENDGQGFHNDPRDPGGATSWGVTFSTWCGWQIMHGARPTLEIFKTLGPAELTPLYRTLFWNAIHGDELAPGVSLMVFDAAVGSGPGNAARWLQATVGVTQDGAIGPVTLAAAARSIPARLVNSLASEREAFYARLPTFAVYGRGWDRRCEDCRRLALSLAGAPAVDLAPEAGSQLTTDDLNARSLAGGAFPVKPDDQS